MREKSEIWFFRDMFRVEWPQKPQNKKMLKEYNDDAERDSETRRNQRAVCPL